MHFSIHPKSYVFIFTNIYLISSVSGQCNILGRSLFTYNDTWQYLTYPDTGLNYDDNLNCEWMISTYPGKVQLEVLTYDLQDGRDFLRITDIRYAYSYMQQDIELGELTGTGTNESFQSINSYIQVVFTSDGSQGGQGFTLRYRQYIPPAPTPGPSIDECSYSHSSGGSSYSTNNACQNGGSCEQVAWNQRVCDCPAGTSGTRCETSLLCNLELEAASIPKFIQSPNYPNYYGANSDCYWVITSSKYLEIEVIDFDLDYGIGDQIWLFDGRYDNDDDFIAYLRNTEDEPEQVGRKFYSNGRYLRVQFFSDSRSDSSSIEPAPSSGFRIEYNYRSVRGVPAEAAIGIFVGAGIGALVFFGIMVGCCIYFVRRLTTTRPPTANAVSAAKAGAPLPTTYPPPYQPSYIPQVQPMSQPTFTPPAGATVIPTAAVTFNHGGSNFPNQPAANPSAYYSNIASQPTAGYENTGFTYSS